MSDGGQTQHYFEKHNMFCRLQINFTGNSKNCSYHPPDNMLNTAQRMVYRNYFPNFKAFDHPGPGKNCKIFDPCLSKGIGQNNLFFISQYNFPSQNNWLWVQR